VGGQRPSTGEGGCSVVRSAASAKQSAISTAECGFSLGRLRSPARRSKCEREIVQFYGFT